MHLDAIEVVRVAVDDTAALTDDSDPITTDVVGFDVVLVGWLAVPTEYLIAGRRLVPGPEVVEITICVSVAVSESLSNAV